MAEAPDEMVDELYGAPFDEFIARRDAAARDLRRAKRRDEADAVKALRKPTLSAWAIDQLVRRDRDRVDGLLAAGAALRQAKGGDALRDATHDERGAVQDAVARAAEILRDAGHPVSDKTAGELRDTLHAVALDAEARAQVERGRLVEPGAAIGFGLGAPSGDAPAAAPAPAPAPAPKRSKSPAKPTSTAPRRGAAKPDQGEQRARRREQVAAARSALRDAEAALRERERELRAAERDVDARERELADAERALDASQRAADRARDALEDARDAAARRRGELDELSPD